MGLLRLEERREGLDERAAMMVRKIEYHLSGFSWSLCDFVEG